MGYILVEKTDDGRPDFYFGGYNKKYLDVINITVKECAFVFDDEEAARKTTKTLSKGGYNFIIEPVS